VDAAATKKVGLCISFRPGALTSVYGRLCPRFLYAYYTTISLRVSEKKLRFVV